MLLFAYYLLKVIICSAVLFGYYWFFLRNKVFHGYNRFYLLTTIFLSLILPLLKFNIWHKTGEAKAGMIQMLQVVNSSDEFMDEIIVKSHYRHITNEQAACWFFIAVSLVFAVIFIRTIIKIYTLKKNNPKQYFNNIGIINTQDRSTPFSFLKNIFWNSEIDIKSKNGERILKHELVHVLEKHSHDKLFINIVIIFFWCNPIFWLLRKELNLVHEFLADKKAVEDGDTAAFAAMILQTTYPGHRFELTNNFFYSPIKRRLTMLTKNNQNKVSYISRLLVLPLAVFVFAAFSLKAKTIIASLPKDKTITVVIDAGHGGMDNGGMADDGTTEKDITLALIKKIKELNRDENLKILFTRETDMYQSPKEKAELTKQLGADLFISVHVDNEQKNANPQGTGFAVWVARNDFKNNEPSKLLASALIASFKNNYAIPVANTPMQRQQGIWVLQAAECPAALIEAGYISNKKDLSYLKSEAGQTQFAKNVLAAIMDYVNNKEIFKTIKTAITDTIPEKGNAVVGNVKIDINESSLRNTNILMIINGKEYLESDLKNKIIKATGASKGYLKNNPEMLAKYGAKAADGVIIMENAIIENAIESKIGNNLSLEMDSLKIIDDSQNKISNAPLSSSPIPLYLVNGRIMKQGNINSISPDRIESINVLKEGQTIAIYGDKGKNGVVEIISKKDTIPREDKVFSKVEEEAQFPGGNGAWREYLQKNLDAGMPVNEGWKPGTYTIITQFIVDKEGNISDISTKDFPGSKTAQMCVDLIKKGPKWLPAKQNNNIVKAYRKQPITFVIAEN